jgi:hypothetical protein
MHVSRGDADVRSLAGCRKRVIFRDARTVFVHPMHGFN